MSLLVYFLIGAGEWYLALRRTLACARGERTLLCLLVLAENLLSFFVLVQFLKDNNWMIAVAYSIGAAAGSLMLEKAKKQ
jgi:hypothetical protein